MYNCQVCGQTSLPGQVRLLHVLYRPRMYHCFSTKKGHFVTTGREIEQEIPVCRDCKYFLDTGRLPPVLETAVQEALEPTMNAPVILDRIVTRNGKHYVEEVKSASGVGLGQYLKKARKGGG